MSRQRSNVGGVFLGIFTFLLVAIIAIGVCYAAIPRFKNWVNDTLKIEKTVEADSSDKDEIIENLKAQLAQKEADEEKNRTELQETQNKLNEAQTEKAQIEAQLKEVQAELGEKQDHIYEMETNLNLKEQELIAANNAKSNLETQLSAAQQTITEKESRISELTSAGEENQAEIERLQGEIESEKEKANGLQSQLETKTQEIETLNGQIDSITQEKERLNSELEQIRQEKSTLENTIEENNGKISQLTQKVAELEESLNNEDAERKYLYDLAINSNTLKQINISDSERLIISTTVNGIYYADMNSKIVRKLYDGGTFYVNTSSYTTFYLTSQKNALFLSKSSEGELVFYDNLNKEVTQIYSGDCSNMDLKTAIENDKGNIIFQGGVGECGWYFNKENKNITKFDDGQYITAGVALKNGNILYTQNAVFYMFKENTITAEKVYNPATSVRFFDFFYALKSGDVLVFTRSSGYNTDNAVIYNYSSNKFTLQSVSISLPDTLVELSNGDAFLSSSYGGSSYSGLIRYKKSVQKLTAVTNSDSSTVNDYDFTNVLELENGKVLLSATCGVYVVDDVKVEKKPITSSGVAYEIILLENNKIFLTVVKGRYVRQRIYLLNSSYDAEEISGYSGINFGGIGLLKMKNGNIIFTANSEGTTSDDIYLYDIKTNTLKKIYSIGYDHYVQNDYFDILEEDELGVHIKSSNPNVTDEYYYKFEDDSCEKIEN